MKVQLFKISIDAERIIFDQNTLNDFLSKVAFKESSAHFVESENAHWSILIYYEEKEALTLLRESVVLSPIEQNITAQQQDILTVLKQWRNSKASELNFSAYRIARNSELMDIALKNPQSLSQLRKIKGFGELKTAKYGEEIIAILKEQY